MLQGVDRTVGVWAVDVNTFETSLGTPVVFYASANVVLLGDSGVGKSGLAQALTGASFEPTGEAPTLVPYGRSSPEKLR